MLSRIRRRRLAGEAGISLIEILVAILVLGVILTGLATTLITSLVSLHGDELRVRASQLANQVIEDLQASPWDETGFFEDDAGYLEQYDGEDTVTLGDSRDGAPGPRPTAVIDRDGIDYEVTTNITWVDESGEEQERLKAFDVLVEWTARGVPQSHSVRAVRAPTPDEVAVGEEEPEDFEITSFTVNPQPVELSELGFTQYPITIRLTTSLPALTAPRLSVELDETLPTEWALELYDGDGPEGTEWRLVILEEEGQVAPGAYEFVVDARKELPSLETDVDQAVETVWFVKPSDVEMEVQEPTFSPGPFCRPNGNPKATHFAVTVRFEVHGVTGADSAYVKFEGQDHEYGAGYVGATAQGAVFEAVIPQGTPIDKSQAELVLRAYRTVDSQEATLFYSAPVESENNKEKCAGYEP